MHIFFAIIIFSLILFIPCHASDFNIKLRKTDVNDLKHQLMPVFDKNIVYLNRLLNCLEQGKSIQMCIDEYSLTVDGKHVTTDDERDSQIAKTIKNKMLKKNIQKEELIFELKKYISEIKSVKLCLNKSQTINELKDCVVHYDKK